MFVWDWEAMVESVVFQFLYEAVCPRRRCDDAVVSVLYSLVSAF